MTETASGPRGAASARGNGKAPLKPGQVVPAQAPAKGGKGMKIERIHTKPGVHPYDEVVWERRDVVMTNWRDGSINFEQKGVEFPDFWSVNAANIVTTKYFRGAVGTPVREWSLKQLIDRIVKTYRKGGEDHGYFAGEQDAEIFEHELAHALLHQMFAFNSPVWFNVGTKSPQQVSACFILAVDDSMDSILNWYREEGLIFKGGSGAGLNLSRIRSSKELLSSGGNASGPVSFMRGADASAGTIKSGGATRRAAKMVVLDVDHPDIEEFVQTKAREEDKIRALRDAGFDMDLGGRDITSVQYQNANNSVRVTDEFLHAVENGERFGLRGRQTGEVIETLDAKKLFRDIAQAAWECADPGLQYDDTINAWHTNPETGRITASNPCSEYLSLDNSSCNLASLNLMKFLREDDSFDTGTFVKLVELIITAMDISISFADFPTPEIGQTTRDYRQLGIGYANLGALLMATGHAYDSEGGRAIAAAITSLMTGVAYRRSAELAGVVGPYNGFARNAKPHAAVMKKHSDAAQAYQSYEPFDAEILELSRTEWKRGLEVGAKNGWRNAQASLLAPTGTIGFMMDVDTTGVEPDLALVKFKKLVGGGSMQIVNNTVPRALQRLGYQQEQIEAIVEYIGEQGHVVDAPGLKPEHYSVFDCAMGERSIAPMGHVRMMAAIQPFLSGAISKTVNMPEEATVEDVEEIYFEGWKLGLKALAIYRNNCKVGQPLQDAKGQKAAAAARARRRALRRREAAAAGRSAAQSFVGGGGGQRLPSLAKAASSANPCPPDPNAPKTPADNGTSSSTPSTPDAATPAPSPTNPTTSVATPGPAPVGVPNFFIEKFRIPPFLLSIYQAAGIQYDVPWQVLAAINEIESDYGRNLSVSSAGAVGWMQFLPSSWKTYGVDANADHRKDPYNPADAIFAAARYLKAAGAGKDLRKAIFAYNHAQWYVDSVMLRAKLIGGMPAGLVGSLTGLTQGHFPVHAPARYADRHRDSTDIFSHQGAPVIAVQDGVIRKIGQSPKKGKYVVLQDAYGNRYTYKHLGSVQSDYPVPKPQHVSPADVAAELKLPNDPAPAEAASAGHQRQGKVKGKAKAATKQRTRAHGPAAGKAAPSAAGASPPTVSMQKERLYAHPARPPAYNAGGKQQLFQAGNLPGFTTFKDYFTSVFGLNRKDVELKPLRKGSQVIAGTILGRVGEGGQASPHMEFAIRPAGRKTPQIDPKPILDGWKLLESTAIYRAAGKNPFFGSDGRTPTIGQVLLMSKEQLQARVLEDPRIDLYSCGRDDIRAGQIDRRVLATLEFLADSDLRPTVSALKCGHGYLTTSGNVSEHSSGDAVDIAAINGTPILGHQGKGSITDTTIQRLLALQGTMRPHQIISLMTPEDFGGADNILSLPDHADHIHVGFRPEGATAGADGGLNARQWPHLIDQLKHIDNPTVPTRPSQDATPSSD